MFTPKLTLKRHAFVLGIADYDHSSKLKNTIADAAAISEQLRTLDFQVQDHYDLDYANLCYHLQEFLVCADGSDTIVVYYAGHGIQLGDENFIVPKDFDPDGLHPITRMVPIHPLLDEMAIRAEKKLLFLDACRNDGGIRPRNTQVVQELPVTPPDHTHDGAWCATRLCIEPPDSDAQDRDGSTRLTRSLITGTGLARPRLNNQQTFIAFAADPGAYALDGPESGNSPFTSAVLNHIDKRGLEVFDMCQRVARDVRKETKGEQIPWTNSNLIDDFSFHEADNRPVLVMGTLGILAGIGSALVPFDLFRISLTKGFEYGDGQLVDVAQHPHYLLTSLFFGLVVAYGAYTWGKRAWWVPLHACAIYTVFAIASRYLFAPIAKAQSSDRMLDALNLETLTNVLFGQIPLADPNATFLVTVLFMAILGGGLTGVGSVVSGAPFHRELRRTYRIVVGSVIGSSAALVFLGFLIFRQWMCSANGTCDALSDGVASFSDVVGTVLLVGIWQGALAANIGWAYAHPRYDDS